MSPQETPKGDAPDRAAEYRAQALRVERALAWILVGAAALALFAVTLRPGEAPLRAPSRDVMGEFATEWEAGEHHVPVYALVVLALGSALVFWPRLVKSLRQASLDDAEALGDADSAAGGAPEGQPARPASRAPPLGLGVFVFSVGAVYFLQAACGGALMGSGRPTLSVEGGEGLALPRAGLRLVWGEGVAELTSGTSGAGAQELASLKGRATTVSVAASRLDEDPQSPQLWLVAGSAAPTSETATLLGAGAQGELSAGDSLWVAGGDSLVGYQVEGPGLAPLLKGSVLGSAFGFLGILFLLGVVGRGSEGGTPRAGLEAAGITPREALREVGRGLFGYLGVLPVLYGVIVLTQVLAAALGIPAEHHAFISALQRDPSLAVWVVLAAGVAAPLLEEVLFRGLALRGLSQTFGFWGGLAAQALLFAAVHAGFSHLLPMLLLGWTLGALRLTSPSGSLIAPLTLHAAHNGATLAFVLWVLA